MLLLEEAEKHKPKHPSRTLVKTTCGFVDGLYYMVAPTPAVAEGIVRINSETEAWPWLRWTAKVQERLVQNFRTDSQINPSDEVPPMPEDFTQKFPEHSLEELEELWPCVYILAKAGL